MGVIKLRIFNESKTALVADIFAETFEYTETLNQSGEWSASIPGNTRGASQIVEGSPIEVYEGTNFILAGEVQNISENVAGDGLKIALSGRDVLDELYKLPARNNGRVGDRHPVISTFQYFLYEKGWTLGEVNTMLEENKNLFFVRESDGNPTLMSQILTMTEMLPRTFYRYGGKILGRDSVDMGEFGETGNEVLVSNFTHEIDNTNTTRRISDFTHETKVTDLVGYVRAIGGRVKYAADRERQISLYDALSADPTYLTNSTFPIVEDIHGSGWVCVNSEFKLGGQVSSFSDPPAHKGVSWDLNVGNIAGVERWVATRFTAFPGKLSLVRIGIDAITGSATENPTIRIYEGDENAPNVNNLIWEGQIENYVAKRSHYVTINDGPELSAGTFYWFAAGFATTQASNTYFTWVGSDFTYTHISRTAYTAGGQTNYSAQTAGNSMMFAVETIGINYPAASQRLEHKNDFAPKSDTTDAFPTALQIKDAGEALYSWAKRYLTNRSKIVNIYNIKLEDRLTTKVGDKVKLFANYTYQIFNPQTYSSESININLRGEYRIDKKTTSWSGDKATGNITISDAVGLLPEDQPFLEVKEEIPPVVFAEWWLVLNAKPSYVKKTYTGLSGLPNTTMSNGRSGLLIEIARPTEGEFDVNWDYNWELLSAGIPICSSPNGPVNVELVQQPRLFDTEIELQIKVSIGERDWTGADTVDVEVWFMTM